jgi:acyl-CoA reductase-like NAD-dependent aldehyde dehydrogenase
VARYKLLAFGLSSFYAGTAGALLGHLGQSVNFEQFELDLSIQYLAMIVIGGLGSIPGSIFGAVFITLLPILLRHVGLFDGVLPGNSAVLLSSAQFFLFGLVIVVFMVIEPRDLARIWRTVKDYVRLWPFFAVEVVCEAWAARVERACATSDAETMNEQTFTIDVDGVVARAVAAQHAFESWSEARVDALLGDIAQTIVDHAEELAVAAVEETGLGNVVDKTEKNRLASARVFEDLVGKPAAGVVRVDREQRVAELASPMGVIFGLVPRTHPVATFTFKVLIALKGRNALILSCHRSARQVTERTGALVAAVLDAHGAPHSLVQWLGKRTDREVTLRFMRHPDVAFVLATGGASLVRAAYSSGTPAIGVGPGNAPTWVCADADLDHAAETIVASKSYDNGIVCAGEHNLLVDVAIEGAFSAALERHGAAVLRPQEIDQFIAAVFDAHEGHVRRDLHGLSAVRLAEIACLTIPGAVRLIVVPAARDQVAGPLGREKLAPVTSLFAVLGDDDALAISARLLDNEGAGHTAIIHTRDERRIERFSRTLHVSRVFVNGPGAQGSLGLASGLAPSLTLGTGTHGGTSTTDSVTYRHLLNIKRVAYLRAA